MKEGTSRLYSAGLSRLGRCPASGIRIALGPGQRAAELIAHRAPPSRVAGAVQHQRRNVDRHRRRGCDAGRLWPGEQIARGIAPGHERQQLVRGALVGPQRGKRMPLPLAADCVDAPRPRQLAIPVQRHLWLAGVAAIERRAIEDQTRDPSAKRPRRGTHRTARSLRHADDRHPLQVQSPQQRLDVARVGRQRWRPGRQSEAPPVITEHPHPRGPRRDLRLPHVEVERPAVNEQHRESPPLVAQPQSRAIDLDEAVRRRRRVIRACDRCFA